MLYASIKHYRTAKQKEDILLFNVYNGSCIILDSLSYEIFKYIEKNTPSMESIQEFAIQKQIHETEAQRLIQCLLECEFICEKTT